MSGRDSHLLSRAELTQVRARSDLIGVLLVVHAWAVIFGAMALLAAVPHPLIWLLGIVLVGGRQLGIAVLMHDAAHGVLTQSKWLNEFLGQWLCALPVGADLFGYRAYHLKHHRVTQQADDPDLILSAPFPVTRASLTRKIVRDLSGQTTFKQRAAQLRAGLGRPEWPLMQRAQHFVNRLGGALLVNALLLGGLAALGQAHLYLLLWVVPFFTWLPLITRLRNIAEHAMVPDNDDPFRNARTTIAGPVMRAILAPYWVNYHVEHHLLMFVPCYQLPKLHALLIAKGFGPRMEIQPDYWRVLEMASSAKPGARRSMEQAPRAATADALAFNGRDHGAAVA